MLAPEIERSLDWGRHREATLRDPDAAESGRLVTAHALANDPEGRKRMEETYGGAFCRSRYPEAYKAEGLVRWFDKFRLKVPW